MKNEAKKLLTLLAVGLMGGLLALGLFSYFYMPNRYQDKDNNDERALAFASLKERMESGGMVDFVEAAELSTPSVVHIKTVVERQAQERRRGGGSPFPDFFDFFGDDGFRFEPPSGPRGGSGSGVIITADGYIATNNHVIDGASRIEVTLNDRRTYQADLIGKDPTTDLALLKIQESNLPFLPSGNSDQLKVGEWVIAVGNPMNLNSTVTAGIISAKGRSINLLRNNENRYAIENFLQTDAAINPGNSGGALVNTRGELIGINTAIASQNGGFIGYGFAIPINLAKKVLEDIREFGVVQRGLLGVTIQDITTELAEKEKLKVLQGVFVNEVMEGSAASKGGIKSGDVITKVQGKKVNASSELQEEIGRFRPGDKVSIEVDRKGKSMNVDVVLLNQDGKAKPMEAEVRSLNSTQGLILENLNSQDRSSLGIRHGVKVTDVKSGVFKGRIPKGFVITHIDKQEVHSVSNAIAILEKKKGGVLVEGKTAEGKSEVIGVLIE
jgi:Do/DeqQ family serine protease